MAITQESPDESDPVRLGRGITIVMERFMEIKRTETHGVYIQDAARAFKAKYGHFPGRWDVPIVREASGD